MFDLKQEAESYIGQKIDLDKMLSNLEKNFKKQGGNKNDFKQFKKVVKSKAKRHHHKVAYMTDCLAYNVEYDSELEDLNFKLNYSSQEYDEDEIILSAQVEVGLTMALCGGFLWVVSMRAPSLKTPAEWLMGAGLTIAIQGGASQIDDNKKKDKKKD